MAKRKTFGQLSERSRNRAVRAGDYYGLSRKQVRDRYNRGTFNPFSRTRPELRVPREVRQFTPPETGETNWKEAAVANMRYQLSDYHKYPVNNDFDIVDRIYNHASPEVLRAMAMATEDDLMAFAYVDSPTLDVSLPFGLTPNDIGYWVTGVKSKKPEWVNVFWYH